VHGVYFSEYFFVYKISGDGPPVLGFVLTLFSTFMSSIVLPIQIILKLKKRPFCALVEELSSFGRGAAPAPCHVHDKKWFVVGSQFHAFHLYIFIYTYVGFWISGIMC